MRDLWQKIKRNAISIKAMFKQETNVFMASVLILCTALSIQTIAQDSEQIEFYRNLPVNEHLMSANLKLNKLIQDAESIDNPKKLEKLTEVDNLLWEAIRKYEFYRTGRMKDTWRAPSPDSPLEKSPLTLLEHLRIAYKKALQRKTSMMIADRQYTQKETEQYNSLKEALDFMTKAITKMEDIRGWRLHEDSQYGISIEAPLGYMPNTTRKPFPIDIIKLKEDEKVEKRIFIRVRTKKEALSPKEYQSQRIEEVRQMYPDMFDVRQGEPSGDEQDFATWFTYRYTWEGDKVKALVYIRNIGERVYEINCLALAESFDREEFDKIIKSFKYIDGGMNISREN